MEAIPIEDFPGNMLQNFFIDREWWSICSTAFGPLPILPYGIFMNPNNGAFFGVPLEEWEPTTYAVAATNHLGVSVLNGFITLQVVSCPSIVDTVAINKTISPKELPFTWNGKTFTDAGQAYFNLTNSIGCDSVVVLNLKLQPEFN